jgi:hypothetical protein
MGQLQETLMRWGQNNFVLALLSSGAILSWTLLNKNLVEASRLGQLVAFLTFLITGALGLISFLAYRRLKMVGRYMKEIEYKLGFPNLGWHRRTGTEPGFNQFRNIVALAWMVLLIADLAVALLLIFT